MKLTKPEQFHLNLIIILACLLKECSRVDDAKIKAAMAVFNHFGHTPDELQNISQALTDALAQPIELKEVARQMAKVTSAEERILLFEAFVMLTADLIEGRQRKYDLIDKFGIALDILYSERKAILQKHIPPVPYRYFWELGLDENASRSELQRVYRNLSLKFHPDRLQHLRKPFIDIAKRRFQRINEAYHELLRCV